MKPLLKLADWIDALNQKCGIVATAMVFAACFVSAGNAIIRYIPWTAEYSSNALLEMQWYMFSYVVMLGASYTFKMNEHVRVDLVYGNLPPRGKAWVDLLGTLVFMMPAVVISAVMAYPFFADAFVTHEMSQNAGGLVRWPAKLALPLGFALLALQGVSEMIKRIGFLTGNLNMDMHYERPVQ